MAITEKFEPTFYLVELRGRRGTYFPEGEPLSKKAAIAGVKSGEWDAEVVRVIEVTVGEPSRDVTEDFAKDIFNIFAADGEQPHHEMREWLEDVLGAGATAPLMAEGNSFDPHREWGTLNRTMQGV